MLVTRQGRYLGMSKHLAKDERGIVLLTVLLVGLLVTFVGLSLVDVVLVQYRRTSDNVYATNALLAAEAGIEKNVYTINETGNFSGLPEEEFYNNADQGSATYGTTVTGANDGEYIITSTGRAYNSVGNLVKERKVRVTIVGTQSLQPNVYAGAGGLILSGSVNVSNTDIYVEGFIRLDNSSASIGSPMDVKEIKARNVWCMVAGNYPSSCPFGTQPITLNNNAKIYGHVCANGQTDGTNIFDADGGPGLDTGCPVFPVVNPYTYDRDAHIASMNPALSYAPTSSSVRCGNNDDTNWLDGTTITGDITINSNSCELTISGNIYIQGDLDLSKGTVRVADGLTTRPVVVVNGTITTRNNLQILANDQNLGARFISYKCRNDSNAAQDGCNNISDLSLYNSREETVIDAKSSNGAIGSIFQAYWGKVDISASGTIASAVGQAVELSGNGSVVFGDTLSSEVLSIWTIRSYQYDFD
jgi:Tfp pilus assembly protein PilX